MAKSIAVIGSGIGGLAAAIRLAAAGRKVTIFEQNKTVGGKMGQIQAQGYRWDTGPSVITMRHVLEDLFAAAGRQLADYITLQPVDPLTRYFYPDGAVLDATRDLPAMTRQIAAINQRDVEGYLAYLAYAARLHRITGPAFIYSNPPSWRSFTKVPPWDAAKIDSLRTMDKAIASFVKSPQLRQMLGRFATYVGGNPYQAPATLNVIAHVELTGGVWYPQGGIYTIAAGLAQLAAELGVDIYTDCPVRQIVIKNGNVEGVLFANGDMHPADVVVSNVDVATSYKQLLSDNPTAQRQLAKLTKHEPSGSGFILLLGVNKSYPQLAHHNIFFSADYRTEFDDIFKRGIPPNDPTIYVSITAKSDPQHAPPGGENWFVLVNAPPLGPAYNWAKNVDSYRKLVLDRLADYGLDARDHIQAERILTPEDLARHSGAWRGALYGASSNSKWAAFRRPNNRSKDFGGLYFVGGTTHPGGGVPMVTLSGKVVAEMVMEDTGFSG